MLYQVCFKNNIKIQLSGYSYGSIGTKTADEMFEELGYKRCDTTSWKWVKLSDEDYHYVTYIWIYNNKFAKWDEWDEKEGGIKNYHLISEAEDKAIHKKIEELIMRSNEV